jgi:uncharacterized protein YegP (UPF0339 family)
MAGHFELCHAEGGYRVRLVDKSGAVVATSIPYPNVEAAAEGIDRMREIASTGLIQTSAEKV